jgi:Tol biopolymer transport system component
LRYQSAAELRSDLKRLKRDSEAGRSVPAGSVTSSLQTGAQAHRSKKSALLLAGAAVGAVVFTAGLFHFSTFSKHSRAALKLVPFTSSQGEKSAPVFSPDGNEITYTWSGDKSDNTDIYVKLVGAGRPLRLTSDPAADLSPTWSPDGRFIAFLRRTSTGAAYYVVPTLGGPERKIADAFYEDLLRIRRVMDWSPDGKYLAVTDLVSPQDSRPSVLLLSVEDGQRRVLASPSAAFLGAPTFSPDGKTLAFVQGAGFLAQDIFVLPVSGGEPRRLTVDNRLIDGLTWTRDAKQIVFSSTRTGLSNLWQVSLSGGPPELISGAGEDTHAPSISPRGDRLAYVHSLVHVNIWRTEGPGVRGTREPSVKLIASSRIDGEGDYSPDGKRIAFTSDRSGNFEIWAANDDGSNPVQLTSLGGSATGSPSWSPDGKHIAFDSRLEGHSDIFVISAEGGSPRRVTTENAEDTVPAWSRNGEWIYFDSDRTGMQQIWKVPVIGGAAMQITKEDGFDPQESRDGSMLYFLKDDGSLWKMPVGGGEPVRALTDVYKWQALDNGICFLDRAEGLARIKFFDFATGRTEEVTTVDSGPLAGNKMFSVSPDAKWILYGRVDQLESDVMLVENFR